VSGRQGRSCTVSNTRGRRYVPARATPRVAVSEGASGYPTGMRIVVTGATGNVGTAVLRALGGGSHTVVGVARRPPEDAGPPYDAATWHALDLTRDDHTDRLREAVRGADAVVHLVWGFQPSHRLDYLEELGVGGTRRVGEAAAAEGVPHLVHMSSVGAYSPRTGPEPVSEDYPTDGVPTSPYSRHKSAAERWLDGLERLHPDLLVTRLRPGIIGQSAAGSALLRYAVPGIVPAGALRLVPVLPIDRRLSVPVVHADDVAQAVVQVLERRVGGAFNLASGGPVTSELVGAALRARPVHVPARALRGAVAALWHARLEQLDPGWIDLAYAVPLMDTSRAERELGWQPRHTEVEVLDEIVAGMVRAESSPSPVLRPRRVLDNLRSAVADGPVHRRARP
jgi:nucleoside-diphosphate-sugar epimerase